MDAAICIGANKGTIDAARETILAIVQAEASNKVKVAALEALTNICQVNNTVISDCTFEYHASGERETTKAGEWFNLRPPAASDSDQPIR